MPLYSTGGAAPTAWVMSAVIPSLGSVLRSVQVLPPSLETKIGAVPLADPPGLGVKAEAAMSCAFEAYSARNGSASCQVSPLSVGGIRSTTRTPATLAGGVCRVAPSQAAYRATVAAITLVRMSYQYIGLGRGAVPGGGAGPAAPSDTIGQWTRLITAGIIQRYVYRLVASDSDKGGPSDEEQTHADGCDPDGA